MDLINIREFNDSGWNENIEWQDLLSLGEPYVDIDVLNLKRMYMITKEHQENIVKPCIIRMFMIMMVRMATM